MKQIIFPTITAAFFAGGLSASTIDTAERFLEHNLSDRAKEIFIEIATGADSPQNEKATAIFHLGSIAFNEGNIDTAIREWRLLQENYPEQATEFDIEGKLKRISDIYGDSAEQDLQNAIAQSYIKNGDFYTDEKSETTTIDTSWIPVIDASVAWYDRVIEEFPGTSEAKRAYLKKFAAYVGWPGRGQYDKDFGLYANKLQVTLTLAKLEEILSEFEAVFPDDPNLQRMRYTIAQGYWRKKDWAKTREWLTLIIESDDGVNGFWKDVAEWRLKKVEY